MKQVDVHVLIRPDSLIPKGKESLFYSWRQQCFDSLQSPIINKYAVNGPHVTNFFNLRKRGFSYGSAKYVSFVNDDDVVIGDPFSVCVEELEKDSTLCGVYTNSYVLNENKGTQTPFYAHREWTRSFHIESSRPVHEIVVMKREVVHDAINNITNLMNSLPLCERNYMSIDAEQIIYTAVARYGDWKFIPDLFGFIWRKHGAGRHKDLYIKTRLASSRVRSIKKSLLG